MANLMFTHFALGFGEYDQFNFYDDNTYTVSSRSSNLVVKLIWGVFNERLHKVDGEFISYELYRPIQDAYQQHLARLILE